MTLSIAEFIRWWAKGESSFETALLADGFSYDDRGFVMTREEFLSEVRLFGGFSDLTILRTVFDDSCVAAVFEGTDDVTGLRYRITWFVEIDAGRIARLIKTSSGIMQKPQNAAT